MVEFDSFINVEKVIEAKDSNYVTKELSFDDKTILNTPYKIFNVSKVKLNKLELPLKGNIIETTKFINNKKSYDALYNLLENSPNNQKSKLNQFFKVDNTFKSYKSIISLTFSKNPFKSNKFTHGHSKPLSFSNFEYLLDYMYEYSTLFVLIPDIDFKSFDSMDNYMEYIEKAVNVVSSFNNKPIFVPLSMKLDNSNLEKLLHFYKENNYSNIWFNFYSNQINTKISIIRYSLRLINRLFKGNAVTYFSNMKKEINKHLDDVYTLPSDFLGPFFGCDFLGSNRESGFPGKNIKRTAKEKREFERKNLINKNRIFDSSSYYYFSILEYPSDLRIKFKVNSTN
ncbi:hypothetical protein mru_0059 [Methanobrevibacter ruminantium M1]|uniref:Uncharacterized protein n=1 Tax=Methanobrevibacter ruminantium (strain ATCC 35063 / DSM 1093 / JCM 13430 / OCM 146 / M1) TaxID=634498 RepID=D3E4L5_METRM|nr:hypothetical protein [Methanobrevibacter ruminantium]ADC45911.1 hypothetical protein mru_0059 [Methanobrevibacter ruminantium M1]